MLKENVANLLFIFTFSSAGFAQQVLTGKIVRRESTEPLIGVTVSNLSRSKTNISDMGGNYKIPASPGDTILFTSASYQRDTVIVSDYMLTESWLVDLNPKITVLPKANVEEISNYQMDSLKRHEEYKALLDKKHPIKLFDEKTQDDAPGLFISPIDFFSKTEVDKRRLKRRLKQEEEDYYIDYKFPPGRVALLTRLTGDSLQLFLRLYRPSYAFCRKANPEDILLYINDKLRLFRTSPIIFKKP
jgi:hypothetical protein